MKRRVSATLCSVAILLLLSSLGQAGILRRENRERTPDFFIQYLHPGGKGLSPVTLNSIIIEARMVNGIRNAHDPTSTSPFEGGLRLLKQTAPIKVTILETTFIERVNGRDGRTFRPIDIHDDSMLYKRKAKIQFPQEDRQLPVTWSEKCDPYVYMYYPPIPEDIKEAEILVKLKIVSPEGEEDFERRFPVSQNTRVGHLDTRFLSHVPHWQVRGYGDMYKDWE